MRNIKEFKGSFRGKTTYIDLDLVFRIEQTDISDQIRLWHESFYLDLTMLEGDTFEGLLMQWKRGEPTEPDFIGLWTDTMEGFGDYFEVDLRECKTFCISHCFVHARKTTIYSNLGNESISGHFNTEETDEELLARWRKARGGK